MYLQVPEVPPKAAADPSLPDTDTTAAAQQQQQSHSILIQFCTS